MRTACPICGTVFRITPEQLRIRAGKVRCGQCHSIFNALESLVDESPAPAAGLPTLPLRPPAAGPQANPAPTGDAARPAETLAETSAETPTPSSPGEALAGEAPASAASEFEAPDATAPEPEAPEPAGLSWPEEPESEIRPAATPAQTEDAASLPAASAEETAPSEESPEESTQAARQAGLVAARELAEAPGYNRWAAGTLAASPLAGLAAETPRKPVWPFVLAALFLGLALAAQLAGHYRTELVQRLPAALGAFDALGVTVPLPRIPDLVSIEASDLQADAGRGLLILTATLRNRAAHPQSWPALELTLTDPRDAVVARRILRAADYLPPQADPLAFAATSETSLRLWIEAKEVGAAGYRLYVFYP